MIQTSVNSLGRSKVVSGSQCAETGMLKPTVILATLLFLLVAPDPNSQDIAEMTAGFLVPENHSFLLTSNKPAGSSPAGYSNYTNLYH